MINSNIMEHYQIITVILAILGLIGSGVAAYTRLKTDIAAVSTEINNTKLELAKIVQRVEKKADGTLVVQMQNQTNQKLDQVNRQINILVEKLINGQI